MTKISCPAIACHKAATVPFGALKKCVHHPLTTEGLAKFAADWAKVTGEAK